MRVLITGAAGFIGSNLADRLLKVKGTKIEVIGIDNLSYGIIKQIPKRVKFHRVDIRSKKIYPLLEGIDYVFHLAAKNCISDCHADPLETVNINIDGTVNVLEASRKAGVKKIIYACSSAIYEGSSRFPTPESLPKPQSYYAISKFASMYFAESYLRYHGLNFTGLMYFNVFGPRQDYRRSVPPVMSAFIINLLKGEHPVIYGTGRKKRDFVYVDDVNDFHLLCLKDKRTDNKIFNVGSGKNYSILDVYNIICGLLNEKIAPIHRPDLPGETHETLADIREARKVGWLPKIDIITGLGKMISYIKKEITTGNIR